MGSYFYVGGYDYRSVIFAKQLLIAWQIYRNIPYVIDSRATIYAYVEISPVDVVSLEAGSLQAGKLNEFHSITLATVA